MFAAPSSPTKKRPLPFTARRPARKRTALDTESTVLPLPELAPAVELPSLELITTAPESETVDYAGKEYKIPPGYRLLIRRLKTEDEQAVEDPIQAVRGKGYLRPKNCRWIPKRPPRKKVVKKVKTEKLTL